MPDAELFRLADQRSLRKNLSAQIKRMLADPRSEALMKNFTGQWLQARDIETVTIDARQVLAREAAADPDMDRRRQRFRELRDKSEEKLTAEEKDELAQLRATLFLGFGRQPRAELTGDLRRALYAYNRSTAYVDAVLAYAGRIRDDRRAFAEYYNWQVFIRTSSGLKQLTGPGS